MSDIPASLQTQVDHTLTFSQLKESPPSYKGHLVLLRAFAQAKQEVPELELDIAGRGPMEPALKALAKELGVADSIRFLGYVSPIQEAIEGSAIVVVPSLGEGFGMVALESMERARPVIAAEIGGLGELVKHGETGLLVPPGEAFHVFDSGGTHWGIDEYDVANQGLVSHHFSLVDGRWELVSMPFRYVWPSELDLMAELAGMTLRERWSGWRREPFTSESQKHISVWEKRVAADDFPRPRRS